MTKNLDIVNHTPPSIWSPPAPQLIKDARMLIIGYKADRDAIQEVLPAGLEAHASGLVQMNMYEVAGDQTSGFGPFSLTYLAVEVANHDSYAAEGAVAIPGATSPTTGTARHVCALMCVSQLVYGPCPDSGGQN